MPIAGARKRTKSLFWRRVDQILEIKQSRVSWYLRFSVLRGMCVTWVDRLTRTRDFCVPVKRLARLHPTIQQYNVHDTPDGDFVGWRGGSAARGGRADTRRRNTREQKGWISSRHWNLANSRGMPCHTPVLLVFAYGFLRVNASRATPFSSLDPSIFPDSIFLFPSLIRGRLNGSPEDATLMRRYRIIYSEDDPGSI